jgi:hypothetical protein
MKGKAGCSRLRRLWRASAAVAAGGLLSAMFAAAALATPPPTLTGEFFSGAPTVSATCNPAGTSMIAFSVSGAAFGPYPGTFTETAMSTIGPLTAPVFVNGFQAGPVTSFDAFFTITSPTGQVTGTKQLQLPSTVFGLCYDLSPGVFRELIPSSTGFGLHYDATIENSGAFYGDNGDAGVSLVDCEGACGATADVFNEAFRSSLFSVFPIAMTGGKVTGGGQIGPDTTFGLTARSDASAAKGECTVIDRTASTNVKCTDVTAYFETGDNVTIFGDALVNGIATTYRIDVSDTAEPGAGADTFAIHTGVGYGAGGTLTQGNIQVHG